MTMQDELRGQAAFCLKAAQAAEDPTYRVALIELALWWAAQADRPEPLNMSQIIRGPTRI